MIPLFPNFKILQIEDKEEILIHTKRFPPYSDYNFVSLFSWDFEDKIELSILNDNLVIKLNDYITNNSFYSFLGNNNIEDTILKIISQASLLTIDTTLRLIPEIVIKNSKLSDSFAVEEDLDNYDYILSVEDIIEFKGKKWRGKKNLVNRYKKNYGEITKVTELNLQDIGTQNDIMNLFRLWEKASNKISAETTNELRAIQKLLKCPELLDLLAIGVFINGEMKGFSINEVTWDKYGLIHYEKADISQVGIFQYLKQQSAIYLKEYGCDFINYEQDLGINGLRTSKASYHPVKFLKKYTIKLK